MELFTINRYTAEVTEKPKQVEDEILNNLLQKVEKRKRDRNNLSKHDKKIEEAIESNTLEDQPKVKKKKQVKKIENNEDANTESIAEQTETEIKENVKETGPNDNEYKILGEDVETASKRQPQRVDVVLPAWLAHPTIISTRLVEDSEKINDHQDLIANYPYLAPHILDSLKELKVTKLFPVQSAVIPWILQAHDKPSPFRPRDICVSAPTGSGKTLAFAIPVVQVLAATRVECKVRALVVLPVVELAIQVYKVFKKLCEKTDLSVVLFSQQTSFAVEQQNLVDLYKGTYYSKADIVVTTPGRLVDHLHATKGFCLKSLRFLVIDEADRIMDAVFQNWLYHLDTHVRNTSDQLLSGRTAPLSYLELVHSAATQPHKLLFSATLSQDPEKLQNMRLFQPKLFTSVLADVEMLRDHFNRTENEMTQSSDEKRIKGDFIGKYTIPVELVEKICITESNLKPLTLHTLIQEQGWRKFLCFTNNSDAAHRLVFVLNQLARNKMYMELSGNIAPNQREKILSWFARGKLKGLICSDAMARGIDVDVDVVISYDPPRHIKTYIHRIGRTARAGRSGTAVTLLTEGEQKHFNKILSDVGMQVTDEINVSTLTEETNAKMYATALRSLRKKVARDNAKKILAKQNAKRIKSYEGVDTSSMAAMEKLQMAIDNAMGVNEEEIETKVGRAERRKKKPKNKVGKTKSK